MKRLALSTTAEKSSEREAPRNFGTMQNVHFPALVQTAADSKLGQWVFVLEMGDELFAVALRTGGHRASPYDEEVCIGVFFRELPSAGEVVGFHLESLGLVEAATECLKAYFHRADILRYSGGRINRTAVLRTVLI